MWHIYHWVVLLEPFTILTHYFQNSRAIKCWRVLWGLFWIYLELRQFPSQTAVSILHSPNSATSSTPLRGFFSWGWFQTRSSGNWLLTTKILQVILVCFCLLNIYVWITVLLYVGTVNWLTNIFGTKYLINILFLCFQLKVQIYHRSGVGLHSESKRGLKWL